MSFYADGEREDMPAEDGAEWDEENGWDTDDDESEEAESEE